MNNEVNMKQEPLYAVIANGLAFLAASLGIVCTAVSVSLPNIYGELRDLNLLSENLFYGSIAQDMVMLPISVLMVILAVANRFKPDHRRRIAVIGLAWCEFYAFGLYVIQGQYTVLYPLYLVIFGCSLFCMITGLLSFPDDYIAATTFPRKLRRWIASFLLFIIVLMVPIWILRMAPDLAVRTAGETYAVFVLDLTIVFPAVAIIACMLFRNHPFAGILAGIALIKICALCLSWGFAEVYSPLARRAAPAVEMVGTSSFFTLVSGVLLVPYFRNFEKLKYSRENDGFSGPT